MYNPIICLVVIGINLAMIIPAFCIRVYHYDIVSYSKVIVTFFRKTFGVPAASMEYEMNPAVRLGIITLVWNINPTIFSIFEVSIIFPVCCVRKELSLIESCKCAR